MGTQSGAGRGGGAAALAGLVLVTAVAVGQDARTFEELKRWHDKLTRPNEIVSVADGEQARELLRTWNLPVSDLEPEQRGWMIRLVIHAALAVGDAGRAAEWLPDLELDFPEARQTLRAAWLVAGATGDAESAKRTLEKLKEQRAASRKAVSRRLRRLRMIGRPAPDVEVSTDSGRLITLRRREGAVLVVDFWRHGHKQPHDKHVKALRELYEACTEEPKVQFLGVNTNPPAEVEAARKFAVDNGYKWPQHYEQRTRNAPLTEKAFHVGSAPWQVIIDMHGNVRAVGSAGDPAFQYALRAAVAEAYGQYPALRPKTTEGVPASVRVAESPAVEPEPRETEKPVAKRDLPRNPEATRLLNQVRVYLKTGRKTDAKKLLQQIIEKYPGTWEAREAEERLQGL